MKRLLISFSSSRIRSATVTSLLRTITTDMSAFVTIEASLRPLFFGFRTVATQMRIRSTIKAITARIIALSLFLGFSAVTADVSLEVTVVTLSLTSVSATPLFLGLIAVTTHVPIFATVITASIASTAATIALRTIIIAITSVVITSVIASTTRPPILV